MLFSGTSSYTRKNALPTLATTGSDWVPCLFRTLSSRPQARATRYHRHSSLTREGEGFDTLCYCKFRNYCVSLIFAFLAFSLVRKIKIRNDKCCHFKCISSSPCCGQFAKLKNARIDFHKFAKFNLLYTIFCESAVTDLEFGISLLVTFSAILCLNQL